MYTYQLQLNIVLPVLFHSDWLWQVYCNNPVTVNHKNVHYLYLNNNFQ